MTQVIDICLPGKDAPVTVGRLALADDDNPTGSMAFRYDEAWLADGSALGEDLPLTPGVLSPIADQDETDPVLFARSGRFGFCADHAPGKWVPRLLEQARLNGLKIDFCDLAPVQTVLWAHAGHVSGRFSALLLPLTHSNQSTFSPPRIDEQPSGKVGKDLKNLASALEALAAGATFRGTEPLEMLLADACELGGSTPKCVVRLGRDKGDWVVRHSSVREPFRRSLWTAVTRQMAQECGLSVVEGRLIAPRLYAERRFDRLDDGTSLLCLSAASLVRRMKTGERVLRPSPMSYLDIADILNRAGARPACDLKELFGRLLFNTLTGNNRDRLDQFWFTATPLGWKLLPMYCPCAQPAVLSTRTLSTPIRPGVNAADPEAALAVSRYFGVSPKAAKAMRLEFMHTLSNWKRAAQECGADLPEIRRMQSVFEQDQ